jgi:hypothetical protein
MWHDILTKFNKDWYRHPNNIKVWPQKYEGAVMLVLLMEGIYELGR